MWTRVVGLTDDGRLIGDEFDYRQELAILLFGRKYQDWTFVDVHARTLPDWCGEREWYGDPKQAARDGADDFMMTLHHSFIHARAAAGDCRRELHNDND
jgi:hypothetical protein